jgi:hypothetical protein
MTHQKIIGDDSLIEVILLVVYNPVNEVIVKWIK